MSNLRTHFQNIQNIRGAALLLFVIFFLFGSTVLTFGVARGVYQSLVEIRVLTESKKSYFVAEAAIEDAVYRHRDGRAYSNNETFTIDGVIASTTRVLVVDTYMITAEGNAHEAIRRAKVGLTVGDGASFNFGLQSGNGGIAMSNSSSVKGNVFSNGSVVGAGTATVYGDIISAGASGLINHVTATGSAWAHTIQSSVIGKEAYYQSIVGTTVSGSACPNAHCHPASPDQATATLPIPDAMIEDWKTGIENTGTIIASTSAQCSGGTYTIDTNMTLNNVKIECNVNIKKKGAGTTVTIAGPVWVSGNLSFSSGPAIVASSSLGTKSVQIVVDNESNRTTSSKISVNQATNFSSGNAQSYILLLSMNKSAELGGSEVAIDLAQSANGKVLVYASHGRVDMGNNISLKEVTAHQIDINNGAEVIYESGLMSLLFTTGPGGGYTIMSWKEVE